MTDHTECYHFVVVCTHATAVYVPGAFNGWSTDATPMRKAERGVWQLDLELRGGQTDFSYFVVEEGRGTSRAPFGDGFMLPGTWAKVVRTSVSVEQVADKDAQAPPPRRRSVTRLLH